MAYERGRWNRRWTTTGRVGSRGCSLPRRRKGGRRRLQARVVRDIHSPVGAHAFRRAVGEVTLDDGEQVGEFAGAGDVRRQPPVFLPVGQAHGQFR